MLANQTQKKLSMDLRLAWIKWQGCSTIKIHTLYTHVIIVTIITCVYVYSFIMYMYIHVFICNHIYRVSSVSHRINFGGVHQWYITFGLQCLVSVIKWCFSSLSLKVKGGGVPMVPPFSGNTGITFCSVVIISY